MEIAPFIMERLPTDPYLFSCAKAPEVIRCLRNIRIELKYDLPKWYPINFDVKV
jgi:hypothetical protein